MRREKYDLVVAEPSLLREFLVESALLGALIGSVAFGLGILLLILALGLTGKPHVWQALAFAMALPWLFLAFGHVLVLRAQIHARVERLTGLDLDRSGAVGDVPQGDRLVFVHPWQPQKPSQADLAFFIRRIYKEQDWTRRHWEGRELPSGTCMTEDSYNALVAILVKAGVIQGRTEREKGTLVPPAPEDALALFGL